MNKVNVLVVSLIILFVTGSIMFFLSQKRLNQQESILEGKMIEFSEQQELLMQAQIDMQKDVQEKEMLLQQAKEAQQMAEAQAEKERLERERLVTELVGRLKREAEERRQAEAKQGELAEKMKALEVVQAEAKAALVALEEASRTKETMGEGAEKGAAALKEKIEQQNQAMIALAEENKVLKGQHEKLVAQQIATEEAIVKVGMDKQTFLETVAESFEDMYTIVVELFDNESGN